MAKIPFSKLGLKKNTETKIVNICDQDIEIISYLPIQDKLNLITRVLQLANANSEDFYNPGQVSVIFKLEVIKAYTNLNFTKAQLDNFTNTFDLLEGNGIFDRIITNTIPSSEIETLESWLYEQIAALYEYNMSAYGILNSLKDNYNNLNLDVEKLKEEATNPEVMSLLKEIMPMVGDLG